MATPASPRCEWCSVQMEDRKHAPRTKRYCTASCRNKAFKFARRMQAKEAQSVSPDAKPTVGSA